jgi:hypothetical protein
VTSLLFVILGLPQLPTSQNLIIRVVVAGRFRKWTSQVFASRRITTQLPKIEKLILKVWMWHVSLFAGWMFDAPL